MNIEIKTLWDFNKCMHDIGAYVWPGGYPTYFITTDGCALSFDTAVKEGELIRDAIISDDHHSGWHVCAMTVNWEDTDLYCEHSGAKIQSAYGPSNHWAVIVGNIGEVYQTEDEEKARREFGEWCEQADAAHGRASGEEVSLLCNNNLCEQQSARGDE